MHCLGTQHRRLHNSKRNEALKMMNVHTSSKVNNKKSGNQVYENKELSTGEKRNLSILVTHKDRLSLFHRLDKFVLYMGLSCYKSYCIDLLWNKKSACALRFSLAEFIFQNTAVTVIAFNVLNLHILHSYWKKTFFKNCFMFSLSKIFTHLHQHKLKEPKTVHLH